MAWTDYDDVARRFHRTIPAAQKEFVNALISDAEDDLTGMVFDLAGRVARGEVPVERVKRIVAKAVVGVLRNPEGYVSQATTRGPFSSSGTRAAGTVSTELHFSDEDLAKLRPAGQASARSIALHLPAWRVP